MEKVEIREGLAVGLEALTVRESLLADGIIGSLLGENATPGAMSLMVSKVYSLCSVRTVNDVPVAPLAGGAAFDAACAQFKFNDLVALMKAYDDKFGIKVEELKNESSAEGTENQPR